MNWARKPNIRVAGSLTATVINDATQVVNIGDAIWVSYWEEPTDKAVAGYPSFGSDPETIIPLRLEQEPDIQGAMVSIEPTGTGMWWPWWAAIVLAPRAASSTGPPRPAPAGSALKPIVYSASLDHGYTAGSMVLDAPILIINPWTREAWRPRQLEGALKAPCACTCLARSRNLCTVRLAQDMGVEAVIDGPRPWA